VEELRECQGFQWDAANVDKNWFTHRVFWTECEEVFFNQPLIMAQDKKHSLSEYRYYVLGQTDAGRGLFIVFTLRGSLIRVISARDMSKKERSIYYDAKKESNQEST